jgi:hypothetical protein
MCCNRHNTAYVYIYAYTCVEHRTNYRGGRREHDTTLQGHEYSLARDDDDGEVEVEVSVRTWEIIQQMIRYSESEIAVDTKGSSST